MYIGQFKNNEYHGFGMFINFYQANTYIGSFNHSLKEGFGVLREYKGNNFVRNDYPLPNTSKLLTEEDFTGFLKEHFHPLRVQNKELEGALKQKKESLKNYNKEISDLLQTIEREGNRESTDLVYLERKIGNFLPKCMNQCNLSAKEIIKELGGINIKQNVISSYMGYFKEDKREGMGINTYKTGDIYTGEFFNNKRNGSGIYIYSPAPTQNISPKLPKCHFFLGEFQSNSPSVGLIRFKKGDSYIGQLLGRLPHGFGAYFYGRGDTYIGHFKSGVKEGEGRYIFNNGDIFKGGMVGDYMESGILRQNVEGEICEYIGGWNRESSSKCGEAVIKAFGEEYKGGVECDMLDGQGVLDLGGGLSYTGGFLCGKFNGQGEITYTHDGVYKGNFNQGLKHGQGTFILPPRIDKLGNTSLQQRNAIFRYGVEKIQITD